ncbi:PREDICTED: beta-1,4-galactosyltransferase galt-1-like [Amphimedon queenslandica]|uniref:Glycosyltransferase family 92 protein n=1 Tax=Amphimedon queenslandica TaxID=400682 RepID=A0AAN0IQQ2_AMPQE|nr:PREDICTED: beta-1,4-galactosyltransferase galt-1-like [Amphimedon queenslandica]|eukprot:XP_011407741.1 PREDICTED: beta-1,4-galactosyltransferase galt-1-like [Amphimedon queenslandica]
MGLWGTRGQDNYEVYLVKTEVLKPDQYQSVSHITVSTNKDCSSESGVIPIQTIKPKEYDYNFGVCIHKGIGPDFKPKVLLDYVKMHLAVGAEIITIYIQTGAEGVYDILLPYINKGTVEVLDWKLEPNITNGGSHHYGQTGIITECLWRNIYRVKYLGMNDADEFFIPVQHKTISELMSDIDKAPTAAFSFQNFMMKGNEMLPKVAKALSSNRLF